MPNSPEQNNRICEAVGKAIKRVRIAKDISQENLAAAANVERSHMSGIECGAGNPTAATLNRILMVLEISWSKFGREIDRLQREEEQD
jgi:transcriptional regulator with XRE-family HTH domain